MARGRLTDFLQTHAFWAFDASAPLVAPVFTPLFGFSRITAPKIATDVETFKDGTFLYQRSVIKGANVGSVTFERAASWFDSDFYDWMAYAVYGQKIDNEQNLAGNLQGGGLSSQGAEALAPGIRRNLVVIHFSTVNHGVPGSVTTILGAISLATGNPAGGIPGVVSGLGGIGPFEFAARLPARAWLLHNCIPVDYMAGSDFDAASGAVSIMSLEVQPEWIEEFSFGLKP